MQRLPGSKLRQSRKEFLHRRLGCRGLLIGSVAWRLRAGRRLLRHLDPHRLGNRTCLNRHSGACDGCIQLAPSSTRFFRRQSVLLNNVYHDDLVVIAFGVGEYLVRKAETDHPTPLLPKPQRQWHEIGISRTNRDCVDIGSTHGFDHIDHQGAVSRHLVYYQIGHRSNAVAPENGLNPLQTLRPPICPAVKDPVRRAANFQEHMIQRSRIIHVVGIDENRHRTWPIGIHPRFSLHSCRAQTSRHGTASPARSGLSAASPKAKDSGGVQLSLRRVMVPVLRGRP